jgi:hypothetical protein
VKVETQKPSNKIVREEEEKGKGGGKSKLVVGMQLAAWAEMEGGASKGEHGWAGEAARQLYLL